MKNLFEYVGKAYDMGCLRQQSCARLGSTRHVSSIAS